MSEEFREFVKKVGSGTHTSKNLTRSEALRATIMMLEQTATPAQIGAFTIAHRIKRPTSEELAGMLDAYDRLGLKLQFSEEKVVFGHPYDGRSKTVPVNPITTLILSSMGINIILHGGDSMPTKYGITLTEIWQGLGIDFTKLSRSQRQSFLNNTGIGFVYLPQDFPQAYNLIPYREQIGKRPPFATIELMWTPVNRPFHLVSGFVHPPTEDRFREVFELRSLDRYTTVKGLEGSTDLSCNRVGIIGIKNENNNFERFILRPQDYNLNGSDLAIDSKFQAIEELQRVIDGESSQLMSAAIFNGGFYLWRFGICEDLKAGFNLAEEIIIKGKVKQQLLKLRSMFDIKSY